MGLQTHQGFFHLYLELKCLKKKKKHKNKLNIKMQTALSFSTSMFSSASFYQNNYSGMWYFNIWLYLYDLVSLYSLSSYIDLYKLKVHPNS